MTAIHDLQQGVRVVTALGGPGGPVSYDAELFAAAVGDDPTGAVLGLYGLLRIALRTAASELSTDTTQISIDELFGLLVKTIAVIEDEIDRT